MKRIITFVFSLIVLVNASQAVTVNDVAGVFSGTLTGNDTKEVYILPGVEANTVTFVVPDFKCSSKKFGTLVLANIPMDGSGKLSLEGRELYISNLADQATFAVDNANSVLAASTAKVTLSVQSPSLGDSPVSVAFNGTRVTGKNYDIVNGGFEGSWTNNEPKGWHSFGTASGRWNTFVTGNTDQFTQSEVTRPYSTGTNSVHLQTKSVLGGNQANGNCTNGRINAGSTSASDASGNYNYSDPTNDDYNTKFVGLPDSMVFWAKYVPVGAWNHEENYARMNTVITTGVRYQDPENDDASFAAARLAQADTNYQATPTKDWQRIAVPFDYKAGADLSDATYVLITFSTNAKPGGGNSTSSSQDHLYVDDAEMVYNHSLTSLKVDNKNVSFSSNKANTEIVFSESDYELATTTDAKHAQTFIGYDASKYQMYVYVVANNYPTSKTGYSAYTVQMKMPPYNNEYFYEEYICANEKYSDQNFTDLTDEGEYETVLKNLSGGDSTVTLTLKHWPTYKKTEYKTMMQGTAATWNGYDLSTYAAATEPYLLTANKQTIHGCDSIITLRLTVTAIPNTSSSRSAETCADAPYSDADFSNLTTSGVYTKKIKNYLGGDSTITLTLSVWPLDTLYDQISMLEGADKTWEGHDLSTKPIGKDTLIEHFTSSHGCDSVRILYLNVTLVPSTEYAYEASTCDNNLPYVDEEGNGLFNGLTEGGVYTKTIENSLGGDSVVTFTLHVWPTEEIDDYWTMIVGDPVVWEGHDLSVLPVGKTKIKERLTSSHGCDSIRVLHLTVDTIPNTEYAYEASTCAGTPYSDELFEGLTESKVYTTVIPNSRGKDSTVTLTLTVWELTTIEEEMTIVVGDAAEWEGHDLSTKPIGEETLTETYTDIHGCDSVRILHLTITRIPDTEYAYEAGTCAGTPYSDELFEGLTESKVYTTTIPNSRGADSIITLTLTVWELTTIEQSMTITQGDAAEWEGHDLSTEPVGARDLSETYLDIHGCDSLMILHLTVQERVETGVMTQEQPVRNIRKVIYNGQLYIIREDETKYSILGTKIQ